MASKYLSQRQLSAWDHIGDVLIPGQGSFPSFSKSGVIQNIDDILDYTDPRDRSDLAKLMTVLSATPRWAIRLIFWLTERFLTGEHRLTAPFRMVNIGLKGVVYSLYYSEATNREKLGWKTYISREEETTQASAA